MKKATAVLFLLSTIAAGFVPEASATPAKSNACSSCHNMDSNVTVDVRFVGCSGSNANYAVSVSNTYSGQEGWAVFDGVTNMVNAYGSSGTFLVPSGRSYEVWGVSKDPSSMRGSNYAPILANCAGSCTPTVLAERRRLCFDGIDNDCDQLIDAADPDCALENCSNGTDDDGDGKIDCADKKDCGKDPSCTRVR